MTTPLAIQWKMRSVMFEREITATKLAQQMGVNRVTVSNWINSKQIPAFRNPNETLNTICNLLDCTPSDLIVYTKDIIKE
jgi:DNA-binding Xre family transcriptional regulator